MGDSKAPNRPNADKVRIDKWLWAVRLYKTRSLALEACRAGHVKVNGKNVKPSRTVVLGARITARTGNLVRTVKVLALLEQRVAAKLVSAYLEDLTDEREYLKARERSSSSSDPHGKGKGRPSKRDRRRANRFLTRKGVKYPG